MSAVNNLYRPVFICPLTTTVFVLIVIICYSENIYSQHVHKV